MWARPPGCPAQSTHRTRKVTHEVFRPLSLGVACSTAVDDQNRGGGRRRNVTPFFKEAFERVGEYSSVGEHVLDMLEVLGSFLS